MSTRNSSSKRQWSNTNEPEGPSVTKQSSTKARVTPRSSIANELAAELKEASYDTLRQLPNTSPRITTPPGQASGVGSHSARRYTRRTPIAADRASRVSQHPGSVRFSNALTPYRRVADREVELRRTAALTPGKDRRRSGRLQRESPRDIVRALTRALALGSKAIGLSPQSELVLDGKFFLRSQEEDDDRPEPQPRLSIPLGGGDDDDDSLLLPPMRSAEFVEDDNLTQRSVEQPRRAAREQPPGLLRDSFGSIRTSDRFQALNELDLDALPVEGSDSIFIEHSVHPDYEGNADESILRESSGGAQQSYNSNDVTQVSMALGRTSDIRPHEAPEDDSETTFILSLPGQDFLSGWSGLRGQTAKEQYDERGRDNGVQAVDIDGQDRDMAGDVDDPALMYAGKPSQGQRKRHKAKKGIKVSRHGIQYSLLPTGVVKKLATTLLRTSKNSNATFSKDALEAILQASEWFFEQVSDDLGVYAEHSGRRTIDETDVLTLIKRQRQTNSATTPFALAQKYLPRELLQDVRMALPSRVKRSHQLERADEEVDEGISSML